MGIESEIYEQEKEKFRQWYLEFRNEMADVYNVNYSIAIASWTFQDNHRHLYDKGLSPKEAVEVYRNDKTIAANQYKNSKEVGIKFGFNVMCFLIGLCGGCAIMFICNKDAIRHYNVCQESQLLDSISRIGDEESWYIKEDAFGKIKLIQLSNRDIDSLNNK